MKKVLSIFGILSAVFLTAQTNLTNTENYIYSKNCLNDDCAKASENVQYFDSFGKPYQSISIKSSPTGKDVVQHIPYDSYGRSVDSWLTVPMSTMGGAVQDSTAVKSNALSVYGDSRPFSHTILESSPLSRPLSQIPLGQEWQAHPVTMVYNTNTDDTVKKYTVSTTWVEGRTESVLSLLGNYPANTLAKNTATDEDGNVSVEFKNKQGQIILVKKGVGTADVTDTYYVYNEYNHLVYVLPPLAANVSVTPDVLEKLCYQYRYDGWNRLVEKKIPGKGWEYMVYDKADRLILSQDSNLKAQSKWMITKYDPLGRIAYTGLMSGGERAVMQGQITETVVSEKRDTTGFMNSGMQVYYSNVYFFHMETVLSVNYYDTYPSYSFNPSVPSTVYGSQILTDNMTADMNTKGIPVMSLVKNIEDDNWTKNYSWYDTKGRLVGSQTVNHLGGYTKTESDIDFSGLVNQTKVYHKRLSTDTEKLITQNYQYDNLGRLLVQKHKVDTNPEEILTQNEYNELSQLVKKKVGGTNIAQPLQSIDYTYNIRGWMTKINDPENLNGKLFGYELRYNNPAIPTTSAPQYGGNIAEVHWKTATDDVYKSYHYVYDKLNRLTAGIYREPYTTAPNNNFFNEELTYDLNGNISRLWRTGKTPVETAQLIDNLTYNYTGNRLDQVVETMNDAGYEGGNNIIDYDANGNMINMKDKGIQSIVYNFLNLPSSIGIQDVNPIGNISTTNISYLYRADGIKLRKTYIQQAYRGLPTNRMTDYLDGFQYSYVDDGAMCLTCKTESAYEMQAYSKIIGPIITQPAWKLDFVPTSEGFYSFAENRYIYQYKDHLGNARVSFAKNSEGTLEITDVNDYYPFGLNQVGGNKGFVGSYQNYKYNGKELQETGMYDYGSRFYIPDLGRWGTMDPLSEQMRRHSPYNYAFNNPIGFTDPDGRAPSSMIDRYGKNSAFNWESDPFTSVNGTSWGDAGGYGYKMVSTTRDDYGTKDEPSKNSTWSSIKSFFNSLFGGNKGARITSFASGATVSRMVDVGPVIFMGITNLTPEDTVSIYNSVSNISNIVGTTKENFFSLVGGNNDPDPHSLDKLRPGDTIDEPNDMFQTIFMFYGRNTKLSGGTTGFQEGLVQFGLDSEALADLNKTFFNKNDTVYIKDYTFTKGSIIPIDTFYQTPIKKGENWSKAMQRLYKISDSVKSSK